MLGPESEAPTSIVPPSGVQPDPDDALLGMLGQPFNRRTPFFVGLTGAFGVAVAYALVRGIADIASVIVIIGVALFIAIGLNPIVEWLTRRQMSRGFAVLVVTFGFLVFVTLFILAAVPPITHEVKTLVSDIPRYKAEIAAGKGWLGKLAVKLHLTGYLKGKTKVNLPIAGGVLGAGKLILSVGIGIVSVVALTIYFLFALPGVKGLWLALIPASRRQRVELLTNEVFDRVGGFMLGNIITSVVAGIGTYAWLLIFGVRDPLLLGVFVAIFDLIPAVGSTIAGIVVSLVALSKGLPIALATAAFYIVYRFLEDYLLNPRVMKHTVRITPGLTIVATLIGGTLLGLVGTLIAIPIAATIHLLLDEVTFPRQNQR